MTLDLDQIRLAAQEALDAYEAELAHLRDQRVQINQAIKAKVAERDDAQRVVKKLAPAKPRVEDTPSG